MGKIEEQTGFMLLGKTPPGTCPECAVMHEPEMPHNLQSLAYQYKFYDEHGRFPTWKDAMAHCTEEMQQAWIDALAKRGVQV